MAHLILIRHSTSQPQPGISAHEWPLTAEGQAKCEQLANRLRPYQPGRLFHSPEPKAAKTANAVAHQLGIPCFTLDGLHETRRATVPFFADLQEFEAAVNAAMAAPDECVFGEESFSHAQARFENAVEQALNTAQGETIGLVSHGTVLSLYIAARTGLPAYELWRLLDMPAFVSFTLPSLRLCELCVALPQY